MVQGKDREHFEDYREQTQVKHDILAAYLPAYYHILKRSSKNLVYIDGFAGPGSYVQSGTGKTFDGSPILALQLIAGNEDFSSQVSTLWPKDMQSEPAYRQALLELESEGKIEVLGKDGRDVVSVEARRKIKGKATLAKDYYVRLKN